MSELDQLIERPSFPTPSDPTITTGMELMANYFSPSFVKVIQPISKPPFKPPFKEGDAIAVPNMERIVEMGDAFHFVPVFFYPEFCVHNPIQVQGLNFIRDRTLDINSDIAKQCKSKDPNDREFDCPENPKFNCLFVEHLNFVIVLLDHNSALGDTPLVVSFFKGEWRRGMNFISLLRARKTQHICGCRFQCSVSLRVGNQGSWFGLDILNPEDDQPWITDQKQFGLLSEMHGQFRKNYEASELRVDYGAQPDTFNSENKF